MATVEHDSGDRGDCGAFSAPHRAPVMAQAPFIALDAEATVRRENALAVERTPEGYRVSLAVVDPNVAPILATVPEGKLESRAHWDQLQAEHYPFGGTNPRFVGYENDAPTPSLVVTVEMRGPDWEITSCRVSRESDVRVLLRPYEALASLLKIPTDADAVETALTSIAKLGIELYQARRKRGDLIFADIRNGAILQPDGSWQTHNVDEVVGRVATQEITSKVLEGLAYFAAQHNVPLIYQGCKEANPELSRFLADGLNEKRFQTREEIDQHLIGPDGTRIRLVHRREYSPTPIPHAGLRLDAYVRVSAPLRELVDCVNMQQLLRFAQGQLPVYQPEEIVSFIEQATAGNLQRIRRKGREKNSPIIFEALGLIESEGNIPVATLKTLVAACLDAERLPGSLVQYLMCGVESRRDEVLPVLANLIFSRAIAQSIPLRNACRWLLSNRIDLVDELTELGISSGSLSKQKSHVSTLTDGVLAESVWCVPGGRLMMTQYFIPNHCNDIESDPLTIAHRIQFAKLCWGFYGGERWSLRFSRVAPKLRSLESQLRKQRELRLQPYLNSRRLESGGYEHTVFVTSDPSDRNATQYRLKSRKGEWLEAVEDAASEILKKMLR